VFSIIRKVWRLAADVLLATRARIRMRQTAALMVIGATALAAGAALFASPAVAAFPGGNGLIAFSGGGESRPGIHIFTIRPDGSGVRQLTNDATHDFDPSWSADGRRLVFYRDPVEDTPSAPPTALFTINADGGEPNRVVDVQEESFDFEPGFSPSGDRIIYTTNHAIRTIRPDGTDPRQVLSARLLGKPRRRLDRRGGLLLRARYSPSGRRIAFAGTPSRKKPFGIWTVRPDGSDLRRLTDTPTRVEAGCEVLGDEWADYSPDGRHILFLRLSVGCGDEIRVMRADGSHERLIAPTVSSFDPVYAPAGDRIALGYADPTGGCADIYTISATTGSDRQSVTNACRDFTRPGGGDPSWQPAPPSISFAGVERNARRGTAKLRVAVPAPGALALAETTRVKGAEEPAETAGEEMLPVKPTGRARKRLNESGEARVQATVTYTPDSGEPSTQTKRVRLVKRR